MIQLNNQSIIYIISSPAYFTGGTLLLHQLADWLQTHGFTVKIHYIPNIENPIHPEFEKYNLSYCSKIEDSSNNLLIVPEVFPFELIKYKKIQTALWWLSVDNYFRSFNNASKKRQFFNKIMGYYSLYNKAQHHFCQSQYAIDFLASKGLRGILLSDYLHDEFISKEITLPSKSNVILYNPKKGQEFTTKLIQAAPDLEWKPIINMTPSEVFNTLLASKVYIDFGFHPGKDRFPREAAICGCCIITGKRGAAANEIDIPIPLDYKFEEDNIFLIIEKIRFIMENHETCIQQQNAYRDKILVEKANFNQQALNIFRPQ